MSNIVSLAQILEKAKTSAYAIGSFSPRYIYMIRPIILAAIAQNSPAIVQISEKEINTRIVNIKDFAKEFYKQAEELQPTPPLCLHLDHTKTIHLIKTAINCGFCSVMIDASEYELNENISITKETVKYAHSYNVSVEAELGRIGTTDFEETDKDEVFYTDPQEAAIFCEKTNIDAIAVSVGTAHGPYINREPKIDYNRLIEIQKLTKTPLVLHGASGIPKEMLIKSISLQGGGISKVNIATDLEYAMLKTINEPKHITDEILKIFDIKAIEKAQIAVQAVVENKIKDYLLSANKM